MGIQYFLQYFRLYQQVAPTSNTYVETLVGYELGQPCAEFRAQECFLILREPSPGFSLEGNAEKLSACTVGCSLVRGTGWAAIVYNFQSKWPGRVSLRTPKQEEENWTPGVKRAASISRETKS